MLCFFQWMEASVLGLTGALAANRAEKEDNLDNAIATALFQETEERTARDCIYSRDFVIKARALVSVPTV